MVVLLARQTQIFLGACLLGGFLGVIYDFFRISRLAFHLPRVVILLEDILFFSICGVITFLYLAETNDGRVRYFIMLGLLLGATLYYFTLGVVVMRVSTVIISFVSKTLRLLYRVFIRPVVVLGGKLRQQFIKAAKKAIKMCKKPPLLRK